jgi:periplasmic glucans biosynthesis protein
VNGMRRHISRRRLLAGAASASVILLLERILPAVAAEANPPFDGSVVRGLARDLAQNPYRSSSFNLPPDIAKLTYDQYRSIRFDPRRALWNDGKRNFKVEFFHLGFLYKDPVNIHVVENGRVTPIAYSPDVFTFGPISAPKAAGLGFAGFRLHYPINRSDYYDEICAFLGASYFRAVAKGQGYGLSARGLAIDTADPSGEEFPLFKTFWIEAPAPDADSIVVHALLDSRSATAAFRFTIRPGEETVFDTEAAIYPRGDIAQSGIAPLTSMFYFDANDRARVDDYRAAVHDSEGLLMRDRRDEQIWRPLVNPSELQISAFADVNPRGFGLMQRRRSFFDYEDLESRYEKRPSLWVEPIGDWGEGAVELVEIPAEQEIHDNIVSFWRPKEPLRAGKEYLLNYRLHWCWSVSGKGGLAEAVSSRTGPGSDSGAHLFVIDFVGAKLNGLPTGVQPRAEVKSSKGTVTKVVTQPNEERGGWRLSFELLPGGEKLVELQAQLLDQNALSELWLYRWQS